MTILALSPHTDDLIWSCCEHIIASPADITIATPFAAIPADPIGHRKHTLLRKEHSAACKLLSCDELNGPFFDDVYPPPDYRAFEDWIREQMTGSDECWVPLGIHHPDHIKVHATAVHVWKSLWPRPRLVMYEELPYRTRYQDVAVTRYEELYHHFDHIEPVPRPPNSQGEKIDAVLCYASQVDDDVVKDVMVPEQMWRVS